MQRGAKKCGWVGKVGKVRFIGIITLPFLSIQSQDWKHGEWRRKKKSEYSRENLLGNG